MTKKASPFRRRQHAATAEAMLDAAERAMIRHGYERATMQQIARETGCAAGTFYLYFKNKQVLLEALVVRHVQRMHAAAREAMARATDPLEKVRRAAVSILQYWQGRRPFLRLVLTVWPIRPRAMQERLVQIGLKDDMEFRRTIQGHLRAAQKQGLVRRDLPVETLMDFLDAVGFSLVEAFSFSPRRQTTEDQAQVFWGLVAGGIVHQE